MTTGCTNDKMELESTSLDLPQYSAAAAAAKTLSDPMDCSLPGSSVHGIFQARVLEWGAIAFSHLSTLASHFPEDTTSRNIIRIHNCQIRYIKPSSLYQNNLKNLSICISLSLNNNKPKTKLNESQG